MEKTVSAVAGRCKDLATYWSARDAKMRRWYQLIQQVDELKTDKMESFVGNDPRALYNLVLHMLDAKIPHRLEVVDFSDFTFADASESVSDYLNTAWKDNARRFRLSGPRQSLSRTILGFMIATGWYSVFALNSDDGNSTFIDAWNPIEVYPMWDFTMGLSEVAHIFALSASAVKTLCLQNNWTFEPQQNQSFYTIYDYWWREPGEHQVCNAVCIGDGYGSMVKFELTRHTHIPIYTAPVGGLPDTGALSEGTPLSTSTYSIGGIQAGERWKEEIGQSVVATNENIYRSWNKWWTFTLQLLRDTAQPRIFERSRSGKPIVKPEDVFRRGSVWRGGPEDSVDFVTPPPIPLELRTSQLDLEAMMQRGGVSWAMYGSMTGQLTAYVMSQISATANQVVSPFHQAYMNLNEDIDNALLDDIRERDIHPYGWKLPPTVKSDMRVTAEYEIEIPGDLVQKATTARMLNGDFQLSYSYVLNRLFPDIKNPMRERAQLLSDKAALDESNALIALIVYYRRTAAYLTKQGDAETARLYEAAAKATESMIVGQGQAVQPTQPARRSIGVRPESVPGITNQTVPMEATQGGQSSGSETTNSNPALTQ